MKKIPLFAQALAMLTLFACQKTESPRFLLKNGSSIERNEVIRIPVSGEEWSVEKNYQLRSDGQIISVEAVDGNGDGLVNHFLARMSVSPNVEVAFDIEESESVLVPEKQTQAELSVKVGGAWNGRKYEGGTFENVSFLRVPDEHTDHSYDIRYEGPGWESDKGGYRFYLDWRNGMDFFGKNVSEVVLQQVGQEDFEAYHHNSDWGMDLLKVGKTLGLGSIGRFYKDTLYRFKRVDSVTCEIVANGALHSEIVTQYYGWEPGQAQTSLESQIGIDAGSALTEHTLRFSTPLVGFCTGLVANEGETFINKESGDYRLLATYGDFSLNDDQMGLALIVKAADVQNVVEAAASHVVVFKPLSQITYYFMAVWEKGIAPVGSAEAFEQLLDDELVKLNQPLEVNTL